MSRDVQELPPGFEDWDGVSNVTEVPGFPVKEDRPADLQFGDPIADDASVVQMQISASRFHGYRDPSPSGYQKALQSGDYATAIQHVQSSNLNRKILSWINGSPKKT